jgi:hypothetical protein
MYSDDPHIARSGSAFVMRAEIFVKVTRAGGPQDALHRTASSPQPPSLPIRPVHWVFLQAAARALDQGPAVTGRRPTTANATARRRCLPLSICSMAQSTGCNMRLRRDQEFIQFLNPIDARLLNLLPRVEIKQLIITGNFFLAKICCTFVAERLGRYHRYAATMRPSNGGELKCDPAISQLARTFQGRRRRPA